MANDATPSCPDAAASVRQGRPPRGPDRPALSLAPPDTAPAPHRDSDRDPGPRATHGPDGRGGGAECCPRARDRRPPSKVAAAPSAGRQAARPPNGPPNGHWRRAHHGAGQARHYQGPAEKRWLQQTTQAVEAHHGGSGSSPGGSAPPLAEPTNGRAPARLASPP